MNHLPILLTCLSRKIMEHVVLSYIAKHLSLITSYWKINTVSGKDSQLSPTHGCWLGIHTEPPWTDSRTDIALLVFSKAFNNVPHRILAVKLEHYGINSPTLRWVQSFLIGRAQAVSVNGSHSSWQDVTSGVPQGSVLGPAPFVLYVSDHLKSQICLFADDSIIYVEISCPSDHLILQEDLDTLVAYLAHELWFEKTCCHVTHFEEETQSPWL